MKVVSTGFGVGRADGAKIIQIAYQEGNSTLLC